MANNFKNAISKDVGTTPVTTYTSTGMKSMLLNLNVANTASSSISVTVQILDSSASQTVTIIKEAPIPIGSSLNIENLKLVLESGDSLKIFSSVATSCDVIASILQDVQ